MPHWSSGLPVCFPSQGTWVQIPWGVLMWNWDSPDSVVSLQYYKYSDSNFPHQSSELFQVHDSQFIDQRHGAESHDDGDAGADLRIHSLRMEGSFLTARKPYYQATLNLKWQTHEILTVIVDPCYCGACLEFCVYQHDCGLLQGNHPSEDWGHHCQPRHEERSKDHQDRRIAVIKKIWWTFPCPVHEDPGNVDHWQVDCI
jgi:hypothetical protein